MDTVIQKFRSALGGFNRQDVQTYIEETAAAHRKELAQLQERLEQAEGRTAELEAALSGQGPAPETRPCPVCGRPALLDGRRRYCSEACARAALREQKRDYMRKKRGW